MKEIDFLSVSCTGLISLRAVWQYLSVLLSRERRESFQSMSEISASNFVVAYVKKQAGIK